MKRNYLIIPLLLAFSTAAIAQQQDTLYIMKDGAVTQKAAISDIDSIIFYSPTPPPDPSTIDEGVFIKGKRWATRNVATPGHFADRPEDPGMFYQWNKTRAWAATSETVEDWDSSYSDATVWETTNDVCPDGWRIPTYAEVQSLLGAGSVWASVNNVNGRTFGNGDNTIFLPAAGARNGSNGALYNRGNYGSYWSSTASSSTGAYDLYFYSSSQSTGNGTKYFGFSVRCLAAE